MYAVTLLCSPKSRMDPALPEALRNAWGGGELVWLAPDQAAEFFVSNLPDSLETAWLSCQEQNVDLIVQPAESRKKRLLIADMDSTLIQQECVDELAAEAGIGERVAEITARAMNGEIAFEAALEERVSLLKGLPTSVIETVLETRISYTPGGKTLVATMKANGAYAMVVSGGFTDFTGRVAETLGFDDHKANQLISRDGVLTGEVGHPILGKEAKVETLVSESARLGLTPADALAVGDGANDLGMLGLAGTGVALHAKPSVQAACDIKVNHGDLTALLYIQGYPLDAFVAEAV